MSEESTVWNLPSKSVTLTSTMGYPAATPSASVFTTPFSTDGMNWCGTTPPTILSTNSNPPPRSSGSTSIVATPYCPCPPDCFTYRPVAVALVLRVSLYEIRAGRCDTSTPNLRFIRSRTTSMCASPMQYRTVSCVSGERSIRMVGSSSWMRANPVESLSSSPFVLGSTAMASSGSGRWNSGNLTSSPLVVRVSPVFVWASFATAPTSPAGTSETLSWSLPWSVKSWPTRSSVLFWTLWTEESGRNRPENTRNIEILPTYGSDTVLNTCAVSGPEGSFGRSSSSPALVVTVTVRPAGEGNTSRTNHTTRSAPMGLAAAASSTGDTLPSAKPVFMARRISSSGSSPCSRYFSSRASSASATASVSFSRYGSAFP